MDRSGKSYNPFSKTKVEIENFDLISKARSIRNLTALVFESTQTGKSKQPLLLRSKAPLLNTRMFKATSVERAIQAERSMRANEGGRMKASSKPENGISAKNEESGGKLLTKGRRIYVKNIPFSLKEAELRAKVESTIGEIELCYICKKKRRVNSKTDYGFITFVDQETAEKALQKGKLKFKKYKTKLVFKRFILKRESTKDLSHLDKVEKGDQASFKTFQREGLAANGVEIGRVERVDHSLKMLELQKASTAQISGKDNQKKRRVIPPDFGSKGRGSAPQFRFHSRLLARLRRNHDMMNLRLNRVEN